MNEQELSNCGTLTGEREPYVKPCCHVEKMMGNISLMGYSNLPTGNNQLNAAILSQELYMSGFDEVGAEDADGYPKVEFDDDDVVNDNVNPWTRNTWESLKW